MEVIKEIISWVITILTLSFPLWSIVLVLLTAWREEKMKNLSGEEIQELCDEYCAECKNYKWYDDGSAECMLSWNVVYVPEDECCECVDCVPIPIGRPDEPAEGYLGLYDRKVDGEWY